MPTTSMTANTLSGSGLLYNTFTAFTFTLSSSFLKYGGAEWESTLAGVPQLPTTHRGILIQERPHWHRSYCQPNPISTKALLLAYNVISIILEIRERVRKTFQSRASLQSEGRLVRKSERIVEKKRGGGLSLTSSVTITCKLVNIIYHIKNVLDARGTVMYRSFVCLPFRSLQYLKNQST